MKRDSNKAMVGYVALMLLALGALLGGYTLADSYIDRLPDHRGFHLVAVENEVVLRPQQVPRRSLVVVVDGLRQDSARAMKSTEILRSAGQCRETFTGPITISRPVYAVISTGLEQDRTGSRNNDDTSPIAVESIWGVAHAAGLKVHGASNLRWWQELFPGAFDSYRFDLDESQNFFVASELAFLSLVHPVRVDTAGHDHGADSQNYKDAVAKVDAELTALLGELDLEEDLVVLTSDHGHSGPGGHGGLSDEIAMVLTCFAGPTIRPGAGGGRSDARVIAPTLAILLGIPFPRHMRASDDNLDDIWSLVREDKLGADYVAERKASIEEFRQANESSVGEIMGGPNEGWNALYKQGSRRHLMSWLGVVLGLALVLAFLAKLRRLRPQDALVSLAWMTLGVALACGLYTFVRESFDFTSINKRQEFLDASIGTTMSAAVVMALLHYGAWRDLGRLVLDQSTAILVLVVVSFAHPLIYGVTLGFPLPGPIALFLPFILGALVISFSTVGGLASGLALLFSLHKRYKKI